MESEAEILEIFPNEVWEGILSHVKTPADYHTISSASPHFRTLLLPRAPELLFPEMVKPYVECQGKDVSSLTPLRGACRAWKKAVDHELQMGELYSKNEICETDAVVVTTFKTVDDFTRFEQHFDSSHVEASEVNPFVCRAIKIIIDRILYPDDLVNPFYIACVRFLTKYGRYLWSCEVEESISDTRTEDVSMHFYLRALPQILNLTPNLCFLHLHTTSESQSDLDLHLQYLAIRLEQYIRQNLDRGDPFPTLHQLNQIRIPTVPRLVVEWFLERNQHISKVDARGGKYFLVGMYFQQLSSVRALAFNAEDVCEFWSLCRGRGNCQSVEYLWINASSAEKLLWRHLFGSLESHFSRNLTQLYLALPSTPELDMTTLSLKLPKLKTLKLRMKSGKSLQFLMGMKDTLEQLSLDIMENEGKMIQKTDVGDIRLFEVWKQPHKSNIWAKLSKLKLVETGLARGGPRYSGTRAEWKEWQNLCQVDSTQLNLKSD